MNREQTLTAEKIKNLLDVLMHVLNSDIDNTKEGEFDPYDHLTALSIMICNVAIQVDMPKEVFLVGIGKCYDQTVSSRECGDIRFEESSNEAHN